jgi:hypothetical protein
MPRRSFFFPSFACLLLMWVAAAPLFAQRTFDEREIKATFLFNFAQFVEWPKESFAGPDAPFVIGVLGEDPFGAILDEVVRGETVKNRAFVVTRFRRAEDVAVCHILFISGSEAPEDARIFDTLRGRPILTVGDADGFASGGGMIRFVTENKHVRLRVNLEAARAAHLTISSQLLRAAQVVRPGGGR